MAVWSEVGLRELSPTIRLDAEYHQPIYLENIRFLKSRCPFPVETFSQALLSISGGATPLGADYPEAGVPFLRVQNIMQGYLSLDDVVYISPEAHRKELKRSQLQPNDVLLTITGVSYGKAAFVPPTLGAANINQHSVRMKFKPYLRSEYVAMFLNCRFGKLQSDMKITGVTRPALDYGEINSFLIPVLPNEMQFEIVDLCKQSQHQRTRSLELYAEAEKLLLDALGLNNLNVTHAIAYERDFQEVARAGRFDAEYFHPRYIAILDSIKSHAHTSLRQHALISSGYAWKSEYFLESTDKGEPFIRIRDCKPGTINNAELSRLNTKYAQGENVSKANAGDLVVGMDGVKYFYTSLLHEPCLVNQRVCRVAMAPAAPFTPEYLMLVLNSRIGQSQLLREMTIAQTVGHITNENVRDLLIPLLTADIRAKLSQQVNDSITAREDAQNLLEAAKRRVEEIIEGGA